MNEVLYQFELDKKYIEEFPLETTEGTKKMIKNYHINAVNSRNAYVKNKTEEYIELKDKVYQELERRVIELTPKENNDQYINIEKGIKSYKDIIKYNNKYNTIYEKLDFDKIITDMGDIDIANLSEVNNFIKQILEIFTSANINLTINDFDYSMYTKEYMNVYFNNINEESFNDKMKNIFDEIYWECPNLITHLKLNIRYIYNKYNKDLELFFNNKNNEVLQNNNTTKEDYINNYVSLVKQLINAKEKDSYLLSDKFLKSEISIYDYLDDTPQVRKNFNRFLFDNEFKNLNEKEQNDLYIEIKNLKYVIVELNNYNLYKEFLKDIITRYKAKETYKGLYQNKLKEIEKAEKDRINLINQYNKKESKFFFFKKKEDKNLVKVKINEQIKQLDSLYNELDDCNINEIIASRLDETSTIYDALEICSSYYNYFKRTYQKLESNTKDINFTSEYEKIFNYVNDVNNTFIKKIKFLEEIEISDIIFDKYKLLNINISKDDLTDNIKQLEDSVDFVNRVYDIKNSNISIELIKFIVDFKKLN